MLLRNFVLLIYTYFLLVHKVLKISIVSLLQITIQNGSMLEWVPYKDRLQRKVKLKILAMLFWKSSLGPIVCANHNQNDHLVFDNFTNYKEC